MKNFFIFFAEFFIAKRVHIGLLAFCSTFYYMRCMGVLSAHPLAPYLSFFIVWGAYLENLTTDKLEDGLNPRSPHGLSHNTESKLFPIEKFYVLVYVGALFLALYISWKCFFVVFLNIIIFASYVQKWFCGHDGAKVRLKQVFIIKNLIPPLGWILAVVIVPFVTSSDSFIFEYLVFMSILYLLSFREEIKFDIPDIEGDKKAGIKTLPNYCGEEFTRKVILQINFASSMLFFLVLLLMKENRHILEFEALLMNIFPLLLACLYDGDFVNLLFKEKRKEYCNIGIIWWIFNLAFFMLVSFPYNIGAYVFLRYAGIFFADRVVKLFLRTVKDLQHVV